MTRHCNVVVWRDSEVMYVPTIPALLGYHIQAQSLEQLVERGIESVALVLESDQAGELVCVSVQQVCCSLNGSPPIF